VDVNLEGEDDARVIFLSLLAFKRVHTRYFHADENHAKKIAQRLDHEVTKSRNDLITQ
jgi:hypothetical protein